nr:MAG TPA: hypothetical protein [Caudoviricetes sp.]DAS39747.1 MAG TPA: hypothetical protein [Caudoviricetes sp.]DAT13042.1 MAG TPA: hypothetical protein [Caudoviricetes sp.]DAT24312.1 MAG TPA: hypothetical protein [Bacteriophage sp.]DAX97265.1 MAG TPA: hypothetical protein [Caudoviricetes sp.]
MTPSNLAFNAAKSSFFIFLVFLFYRIPKIRY